MPVTDLDYEVPFKFEERFEVGDAITRAHVDEALADLSIGINKALKPPLSALADTAALRAYSRPADVTHVIAGESGAWAYAPGDTTTPENLPYVLVSDDGSRWLATLKDGAAISTRAVAVELVASGTLKPGDTIRTLGDTTPGDGGGASFTVAASGGPITGAPSLILEKFTRHPLRRFGAKGDGAAIDNQALADAFGSGELLEIPRGMVCRIDEPITGAKMTAGVIDLLGGGEIKMATPGFHLLEAEGIDGIRIKGVHLTGADVFGAAPASNSDLIKLITCSDILIESIKSGACAGIAVNLRNCEEAHVRFSNLSNTGKPLRFTGCRGFSAIGNKVKGSILPRATFKTGITLDSTNGHIYGTCQDGVIAFNDVSDLYDAQAFLLHTGERVRVIGNRAVQCAIGISANAASQAGDADKIADMLISGNYIDCDTPTLISGDITAAGGIGVAGSSLANRAERVLVESNVVKNANQQKQETGGSGGIKFTYTVDSGADDNVVKNSFTAGIIDDRANTNLLLNNNTIDGVTGAKHGYWFKASNGGTSGLTQVRGGTVRNTGIPFRNDNTGNAIWIDPSIYTPGTTIGSHFQCGPGRKLTVTTAVTEIDLSGGVDVIEFNVASAHTVNSVINATLGRTYIFRFRNGNTTVARGNSFKLPGSLNLTPNADDEIYLYAHTPTRLHGLAPLAANG